MATPSPDTATAKPVVPRRWRIAKIIVALAVVALLVWVDGYMRWPTDSATGEGCPGVLPPATPGKEVFRVATFNIHSGVGEDDVPNLQRTIDSVRDSDFCGLNEVRGWTFGKAKSQSQELGEATNRGWLFAPTERRFWRDDFGNGLLTRLPVRDWVRVPLTIEPKHSGRRNLLLARVDFGGRIVSVLITHIDRELDQSNQIRMITRLFDSLQSPSLLLADLNAEAKNPDVRSLLALPGIHDCITETNPEKPMHNRIDWILARGFRALEGGQIANGASDHPLYWVNLSVAP